MVDDWQEAEVADLDDDDLDHLDDDRMGDTTPSTWVNVMNVLGVALILIVTGQLVSTLVQGFVLKKSDIPGDIFYRLGYPFRELGAPTLLFLVLGIALLALPVLFHEDTTEAQDRLAANFLRLATVLAALIVIGSLAGVRAMLHVNKLQFSSNNQSVPTWVYVQNVTFLIGTLGTGVAALYGSLQVLAMRDPRRA